MTEKKTIRENQESIPIPLFPVQQLSIDIYSRYKNSRPRIKPESLYRDLIREMAVSGAT